MDCVVDFDVELILKIVCRGDIIRYNIEKDYIVVLILRIKCLYYFVF